MLQYCYYWCTFSAVCSHNFQYKFIFTSISGLCITGRWLNHLHEVVLFEFFCISIRNSRLLSYLKIVVVKSICIYPDEDQFAQVWSAVSYNEYFVLQLICSAVMKLLYWKRLRSKTLARSYKTTVSDLKHNKKLFIVLKCAKHANAINFSDWLVSSTWSVKGNQSPIRPKSA